MSSLKNITGLSALQKELDRLPAKIEANIMRGALRAGQKEIMKRARSNAPVGQPSGRNKKRYGGYAGALRDSIKIRTKRRRGRVTATLSAGGKAKGADVFYAHMVEFGTARHTITGKDGRPMFFGGRHVTSVDHPGSRAQPFMRPAFDSTNRQAIAGAARYIRKRLATKHGINTKHIRVEGDE